MYDLIDRPVADLPAFERGLLDRTRRWVHALTLAGTAPSPAGAAEVPFDAAMRALDRGSTDTLVFQRPCHTSVEEVEAVWLGLWRLVRADRIVAARAAAAALIAPAAASSLVAAMVRSVAHA
jgi:ribosome modulation factor